MWNCSTSRDSLRNSWGWNGAPRDPAGDSIDHAPGGHDDVANAVAGVLVGLDLDRRPALLRRKDMLAGDQPVPVPSICNAIVAVLAADQDGGCAVTYWATVHMSGIASHC